MGRVTCSTKYFNMTDYVSGSGFGLLESKCRDTITIDAGGYITGDWLQLKLPGVVNIDREVFNRSEKDFMEHV